MTAPLPTSNERRTPAHCATHGPYESRELWLGDRRLTAIGCPQCREAVRRQSDERAAARAAHRRVADVAEAWRLAGVPPRFTDATLEGYEATTPEQRKVLGLCQRYAREWPEMRRKGRCVVFLGLAGTGKTHLACAILRAAVEQGATGRYVTLGALLREIRASYHADATRTEEQIIRAYAWPDLLVLDEIGADRDTEFAKQVLFALMDARYQAFLPTLCVSNLPLPEFKAAVGDRVLDRLRDQGGRFAACDWGSYRR